MITAYLDILMNMVPSGHPLQSSPRLHSKGWGYYSVEAVSGILYHILYCILTKGPRKTIFHFLQIKYMPCINIAIFTNTYQLLLHLVLYSNHYSRKMYIDCSTTRI